MFLAYTFVSSNCLKHFTLFSCYLDFRLIVLYFIHRILYSVPVFVNTKKGNRAMHLNGYIFNRVKSLKARQYWMCNQAQKGCKVSVITHEDFIVRTKNCHIH